MTYLDQKCPRCGRIMELVGTAWGGVRIWCPGAMCASLATGLGGEGTNLYQATLALLGKLEAEKKPTEK